MKPHPSIAVAGLGYWGPHHARNLGQLPGCRLIALCDHDPERLETIARQHPDTACFASFDEMLATARPDAVVVATPLQQHFPLAKAALLSGCHVLVEKPMAASSQECRELIQLARDRGLILMVGHIFLFSAAIQQIKKIIHDGTLGEIRYINSQRLNLGLFHHDINVVWDLAPHDLSIMIHLLGDLPDSVNCQGNASIIEGIEDVANLSLNFPGGRFATIQTSWLEPRKVRRMTIVGTRGMVIYDDLEPLEKIRIYNTRVERPPHSESFGDFQYSYHYGDCHIPRIDQEEPLRRMCRHFLERITDRCPPLSCGERGLEVVSILEACALSLKQKGTAISIADASAASGPPGLSG